VERNGTKLTVIGEVRKLGERTIPYTIDSGKSSGGRNWEKTGFLLRGPTAKKPHKPSRES